MKSLDLQSESYSPTGSLASEGVLNQLGRPALDRLTVLIRETVQNSWDARLPGTSTVRFALDGWTLTSDQRRLLRRGVFADTPPDLRIAEALDADEPFHVLAISDRGTSGLDGPTRADVLVGTDEAHDFVDFLRNVGQPPDRRFGGGTYGYGKAALYLASQVRTICVYTRCRTEDHVTATRFMGSALGQQYTVATGPKRAHYTGRHWWGRWQGDLVEPLQNAEADALASQLDLPGFVPGERGTSLLILQPVLDDRTPRQGMNIMLHALLWNFWPKMLGGPSDLPPMTFTASWDSQPISIPDPRTYPPLESFARALDNLKHAGRTEASSLFDQIRSVDAQRPARHLGMLSLHRFMVRPRPTFDMGDDPPTDPIGPLSQHVALLRVPELVVRYISGSPLPSDQIEYAGVFLADAALDRIFADAEPPTHDDWIPEFLEDRHHKTFVRVALRRIEALVRDFVTPAPALMGTPPPLVPLGATADYLGSLLVGQTGPGASIQPVFPEYSSVPPADSRSPSLRGADETGATGITSSGSGRGKPDGDPRPTRRGQQARVILLDAGSLSLIADQPVLIITFQVDHLPGSPGTQVEARAAAVLDDTNLEMDPPVGSQRPEVFGWWDATGTLHGRDPQISILSNDTGLWRVAITVPDDTLINVDLVAKGEN